MLAPIIAYFVYLQLWERERISTRWRSRPNPQTSYKSECFTFTSQTLTLNILWPVCDERWWCWWFMEEIPIWPLDTNHAEEAEAYLEVTIKKAVLLGAASIFLTSAWNKWDVIDDYWIRESLFNTDIACYIPAARGPNTASRKFVVWLCIVLRLLTNQGKRNISRYGGS